MLILLIQLLSAHNTVIWKKTSPASRAGVNSDFAIPIPIPIPAFPDFIIPIPIPELTIPIPIPIPDLQFQFQFQFRSQGGTNMPRQYI